MTSEIYQDRMLLHFVWKSDNLVSSRLVADGVLESFTGGIVSFSKF